MGSGQVSFRFLNKPTLNSTFYVFCCVEYFVLCISFSFTLQTKEKETHPKKKKTLAVFLRPSGVQTKWMYFSIALQLKNLFSLANLHFVLQTMLGKCINCKPIETNNHC